MDAVCCGHGLLGHITHHCCAICRAAPPAHPTNTLPHQTSAEQGYFCNTLRVDLSNTLLNIGIEKMNKQQIFFRKITRLCEKTETRYHQEFKDINYGLCH